MLKKIKKLKNDFLLSMKIKYEYLKFKIIDKFFVCKYNYYKWRDVICNDNQYDFVFLLFVIRKKLKLIEEHWGTHTNHEHDYKEKEKLQELIDDLDRMIDIAVTYQDVSKHEEYQKISKSFFLKLHRLHDKLWD